MSLSAGHAHHSCAVEKREAGLRQLGNQLLHFFLLRCLHLLDRFVRPWKSDVLEPIHSPAGGEEGRGGEGRRRRWWRRGEGGKRAGAGEVSVVQASCKCLNGLGNNESNTKCAVCLGSDRVHRLDFPFPNRCLVREAAAARVPSTAAMQNERSELVFTVSITVKQI